MPRKRKKPSDLKTAIGIAGVLATFLAIVLSQLKAPSGAMKPGQPAEVTEATPEPTKPTETPLEPQEEPAEGFYGKVIKISDGDTCDVLTADKETIRLRWNAVDSPETGQPFGANARRWVSERIGGKTVRVVELDRDRYGRVIAEIYEGPGESINVELVRSGLAWHYTQYAPDRDDVAAAEKEARARIRGLWAGSHKIIAPWDWRRLSKEERDQYR